MLSINPVLDLPTLSVILDVHRMTLAGLALVGKDVEQWFGLSTGARAIKYSNVGMGVATAQVEVVYHDAGVWRKPLADGPV